MNSFFEKRNYFHHKNQNCVRSKLNSVACLSTRERCSSFKCSSESVRVCLPAKRLASECITNIYKSTAEKAHITRTKFTAVNDVYDDGLFALFCSRTICVI